MTGNLHLLPGIMSFPQTYPQIVWITSLHLAHILATINRFDTHKVLSMKKHKEKVATPYERLHSAEAISSLKESIDSHEITITHSPCRRFKVMTHTPTGSSIMYDYALSHDAGYQQYMLDKLLTKVKSRKKIIFL